MIRQLWRLVALCGLVILATIELLGRDKFDWPQFNALWRAYVSHPTTASAEALVRIIPFPGHLEYSNSALESKSLQLVYEKLDVLEKRVRASDTSSVKLAFRLFCLSDADFSESLDEILGELIVRNPALFLEQLRAHEHLFGDQFEHIGGIVGNFGDSVVDDEGAQARQARSRIAALLRVQRTDLRFIRDKCVTVLREMLTSLSSDQSLDGKFTDIRVGMSSRQVQDRLGPATISHDGFPKMIYSSGEVELTSQPPSVSWFYCQQEGNSDVISVFVVVFDAKVDAVTFSKKDQTLGPLTFRISKSD